MSSTPAVPSTTSAPGVSVVGYDQFGNEIRAFNDSNIQSQIARAVAGLSPGAHGAVIAVGNKGSQQLAVVARLFGGDSFSVVGMLSHSGMREWKRWRPEIAIRFEF